MAWMMPETAFDKGLLEYYRCFVPGITHKQYCRFVKKAYREEIVLSPITFIAAIKEVTTEEATEIFFQINKKLSDEGEIPVFVPIETDTKEVEDGSSKTSPNT